MINYNSYSNHNLVFVLTFQKIMFKLRITLLLLRLNFLLHMYYIKLYSFLVYCMSQYFFSFPFLILNNRVALYALFQIKMNYEWINENCPLLINLHKQNWVVVVDYKSPSQSYFYSFDWLINIIEYYGEFFQGHIFSTDFNRQYNKTVTSYKLQQLQLL